MRFITGRCGSGKTTLCLNEIKDTIISGFDKPIIYIVPEQFSFEAEKKLIEICGKPGIISAQVLSFKRLAYKIFNENNVSINSLSDSAKSMLIYFIMLKLEKELQVIKGVTQNTGIVEIVVNEISEFKRYNLTPDSFSNIDFHDDYLNMKIHDLCLIYREYEERITNTYIDSNDELTILANVLREKDAYLNGAKIWIDEFDGFISQELSIIKELDKKCDLTLSMTIGNEDFFELNNKNFELLKKIDKSNNTDIIFLDEIKRFNNNELKHIENNIFKSPYEKYNDVTNHIFINEYKNIYEEIETVSQTILSKIQQDDSLRYENFAILTRDIDKYKNAFKMIFGLYIIPYFFDDKKELSLEPLINLVLSFIDIISNNYKYENMFNYLKTGLTNITDENDIDIIENYVLKWGIKGKAWEEDFKINDVNLEKINTIRNEIVSPIIKFKEHFSGRKTVDEIVTSLVEFLNEINVYQNIEIIVNGFSDTKLPSNIRLAQEYTQVWNVLMNIFDDMHNSIGDEQISFEKFKSVFKIGISCYEVSVIPSTKDKVIIGDIERTRNPNIKSLFIIGVNDGDFPRTFKSEGFINDKERQILLDNDIEIAKDTKKLLQQDFFNIYKAICTPCDDLFISYVISDLEGKTNRASYIIKQIRSLFSNISSNHTPSVVSKFASFPMLMDKINIASQDNIDLEDYWKAVNKWYLDNDTEKYNNTIKGLYYDNSVGKQSQDVCKQLYGETINASVSRLESYVSCPFSFYLKYGLNLKEREVFKLGNPDIGSFMHEIIETFSKKVIDEGIDLKSLTKDVCNNIVNDITDNTLVSFRQSLFTSTGKLKSLSIKLKRQVSNMIWIIVSQLNAGSFSIAGSEVEFGINKEYPPIIIELDNSQKLVLSGKVDRLDVANTEDGKYIRIVDYKSSDKAINLSNVYYGIQLQLLTYGDAMSDDTNKLGGLLYLHLDDPIMSFDKKVDIEEVEKKIINELRLKGLIISNVKLIKAMDDSFDEKANTSFKSDILSLSKTKEGNFRSMPVIAESDLDNLRKHMKNTLKQIGNELISGKISNEPLQSASNRLPCSYCDYYKACQFDHNIGNKIRRINKLDDRDVLEKIKS